ncbi:MAG: hypothetical protein NWR41_01460, partial [Rickettsiaceae bacterium]|nr:hypothetical protein [Rickettsiaceae bacterium]
SQQITHTLFTKNLLAILMQYPNLECLDYSNIMRNKDHINFITVKNLGNDKFLRKGKNNMSIKRYLI